MTALIIKGFVNMAVLVYDDMIFYSLIYSLVKGGYLRGWVFAWINIAIWWLVPENQSTENALFKSIINCLNGFNGLFANINPRAFVLSHVFKNL